MQEGELELDLSSSILEDYTGSTGTRFFRAYITTDNAKLTVTIQEAVLHNSEYRAIGTYHIANYVT